MSLLRAMIISLLLVSCYEPHKMAYELRYIQDPRSNLCFATYNLGYQTGTMATVPCTEKVLKLIEEDKKEQ